MESSAHPEPSSVCEESGRVFRLAGVVSSRADLAQLHHDILEQVRAGHQTVFLDLADVVSLGPTALSSLQLLYVEVLKLKGRLFLVNPRRPLKPLLEGARLGWVSSAAGE